MFRGNKKPAWIKEAVVLKDLQPKDVVVFQIKSNIRNKELRQTLKTFTMVLGCKVLFVPQEMGLETVQVEQIKGED